jgi:hypothetical protein
MRFKGTGQSEISLLDSFDRAGVLRVSLTTSRMSFIGNHDWYYRILSNGLSLSAFRSVELTVILGSLSSWLNWIEKCVENDMINRMARKRFVTEVRNDDRGAVFW